MDQNGNRRKPGGRPSPRIRKSEWTIGTPDAIFPPSGNQDQGNRANAPRLPAGEDKFPEDRWIQATEVRPTAPEVVHHALVFASGEDGIKGNKPELWPPTLLEIPSLNFRA